VPNYRVTFGLSHANFGATETYILTGSGFSSIGPVIQRLIDKRNKLLVTYTTWTGVRVAELPDDLMVPGPRRASIFMIPGTYSLADHGIQLTVPTRGVYLPASTTDETDQSRSCIQLSLEYGDFRHTIRYLAFVPDTCVRSEPNSLDTATNPGWFTALGTFELELQNGPWYVIARTRTGAFAPKSILRWIQAEAAPTNLGVVLPAAPAPGITTDNFVFIAGVRRRGTDKMSYNGRYKVYSVVNLDETGEVAVFLATSEAGDPNSVKLPGSIAIQGKSVLKIGRVNKLRGGVHKRGKPLGVPRGRSLTRAKLDP